MNTLNYAKNLEAVGFSREQAEMTVVILNEVVETKLATQQDVRDLESHLLHKLEQLRSEMVIKLGAMMLSGMAILAGIVSALNKLF